MVSLAIIDSAAYFGAISQLFDCSATVYSVSESVAFDGASPNIESRKVDEDSPLYVDIPCFVEYENPGTVSGDMPTVTQAITLICSNDYVIPEGSTIDVVKHGAQRRFRVSGVADRLVTHQEIQLEGYDYAEG